MKKKTVFTQPECRVYRVSNNNVIATSTTNSTERLVEEDYNW